MKDSIVGMGVVGAGAIGIRSALEHFQMEDVRDKARIVAVCDTVPERAKAAADKYGIPAWYGSYEELLQDSNVDAVTLCSPIGFHYDQAIQALRAGKHIHSNKTITTTVSEIDDMIRLARENGLKVVASPGMMLMPYNQRMRRAVLEGRIGQLMLAITGGSGGQMYHINESYRHGDDILTNTNPTWYFKKPGGGPLYDVTVYSLAILTGILGPAKRVSAFSGQRMPEFTFRGQTIASEVDDTTFISLDFGEQINALCYATVEGDFLGRTGLFTPFLIGSTGMLNGATLGDKSLIYEGDAEPFVTEEHARMPENHVFADIMQLVDWVRNGNPSIANLDHARHVIDIIESAYASAASEKFMTLRPTNYQPLPIDRLASI